MLSPRVGCQHFTKTDIAFNLSIAKLFKRTQHTHLHAMQVTITLTLGPHSVCQGKVETPVSLSPIYGRENLFKKATCLAQSHTGNKKQHCSTDLIQGSLRLTMQFSFRIFCSNFPYNTTKERPFLLQLKQVRHLSHFKRSTT